MEKEGDIFLFFMHRHFRNTGKRRVLIAMATKLILIRHRESNSNVQGKFCGFKDVSLTEKGIWQAERMAYRLKGVQVEAVYCSYLKRAHCTAEIIFRDQ